MVVSTKQGALSSNDMADFSDAVLGLQAVLRFESKQPAGFLKKPAWPGKFGQHNLSR